MSSRAGGNESSLREYLTVIARRKWLLVCVFTVFVVASLVLSFRTTPRYRAVAELNYAPTPSISAVTGGYNYVSTLGVQQSLQSAAAIMVTPDMAQRVADYLDLASPAQIGAKIQSEEVGPQANPTSLLTISAESTSPQKAVVAANAYARVWMDWRKQLAVQQVDLAQKLATIQLRNYKTKEQKQSAGYWQLQSNLTNLVAFRAIVSNGEYSLVSEAVVPKAPYTPRHVRDGLLGAVLGLGVGLASVLLAAQLDVRVRDQEEITDALGLPVLGRIPRVPKEVLRSGGLIVLRESGGASAEAFRMLRGNLDFVGVDGEMRSILMTSATQGEGKTSTICNLAVTLALTGKRVVVVDADLRRPRVHAYFDLPNGRGLSTVIAGRDRLGEVLQPIALSRPQGLASAGEPLVSSDDSASGIRMYALTSGPLPPNPGELVTSHHLEAVLSELVKGADMVLVDVPPFMAVGDASSVAARCDGLMLVSKMGEVTRGVLKEARDFLAPLPCQKLGIVLTNMELEGGRYKYYRQDVDEHTAPTAKPA